MVSPPNVQTAPDRTRGDPSRLAALLLVAALVGCGSSVTPSGAVPDGGGQPIPDGGGQPILDGAGQDAGTLPMATGEGKLAIAGRAESTIQVVVPPNRSASPPLLLAFHGTGGEPLDMVVDFDLVAQAAARGFVVIAPRAGYRGVAHPADIDHAVDVGGSSWNMWTASPEQNDDLLYVRALIGAAQASWGADTTRVYTLGFSNGGFFAYFAAASMPERIAGFAENSSGWTTDACPTRYNADGTSLYLLTTAGAPGQDLSCAQIFADPAYPSQCRVTASNRLRPPTPGSRVPFGYLGHYSSDDTVSVAWSCLLAEGLGARAQTRIRNREIDGTNGHGAMPGFVDGAWTFFAGRTTAQ